MSVSRRLAAGAGALIALVLVLAGNGGGWYYLLAAALAGVAALLAHRVVRERRGSGIGRSVRRQGWTRGAMVPPLQPRVRQHGRRRWPTARRGAGHFHEGGAR